VPLFSNVCVNCRTPAGDGFSPSCRHCGAMCDIEYDLTRVTLRDSTNPYIRFQDLLPVADPGVFPAGATFTPLVHATRLGKRLGMSGLHLKNETVLPTGTTKDRMAAVALAYLAERGVRSFCTSSTGNSSTAYAHAITGFPELTMYLFTAADFQGRVQYEATGQVVQFVLRGATFVEAFDAARDFAVRYGLVSERGFFNPGRREGLKVAWLEAVEQVAGPIDWYVQAVSSAMGVYGVYKGARELHALGCIERLPRLLCVQQETCAPMAAAWAEGSDRIRSEHIVGRPSGIASAILRGNPSAVYPHVRRIVLESCGTFVAVDEQEIRRMRALIEDLEGISPCFSASAAVAGLARAVARGDVPAGDTVLVNLTGSDRQRPPATDDVYWLSRSESGWVPEDEPGSLASRLWERRGVGAP
jgi:threonine synthase